MGRGDLLVQLLEKRGMIQECHGDKGMTGKRKGEKEGEGTSGMHSL